MINLMPMGSFGPEYVDRLLRHLVRCTLFETYDMASAMGLGKVLKGIAFDPANSVSPVHCYRTDWKMIVYTAAFFDKLIEESLNMLRFNTPMWMSAIENVLAEVLDRFMAERDKDWLESRQKGRLSGEYYKLRTELSERFQLRSRLRISAQRAIDDARRGMPPVTMGQVDTYLRAMDGE